jgi:hypothetical protein
MKGRDAARLKEYDYSHSKFIPIHFDLQILCVTFEYSLYYLIDEEIDLSFSIIDAGLNRFNFWGKGKVNIQWVLSCAIHNLFEVYRYGLELA